MITLTELQERRDKIFNAGDLPGAMENEHYQCADKNSKKAIEQWYIQNEYNLTIDFAEYTMSRAEAQLEHFLCWFVDSKLQERKENENL